MARITLPTGTPAELAVPDGPPKRGVVLIPDVGGLRPLFDDLVAKLCAEHSWVVCVVEPWPGRESLGLGEKMAAMADRTDGDILGDVLASAERVVEAGGEPIAVMGFCMGGMYALKAAGAGRFDKAVSFYGMIRVPADWRGPGQAEPLEAVTRPGAAEVLALVGTADPYTPPEDVDALEAAGAQVVRYEGAEHGFVHDPSRPAHRPDDAADAWRRAVDFLQVP